MIISRGHGSGGERTAPPEKDKTGAAAALAEPAPPPAEPGRADPPLPDLHLVHHRLAALERLACLRDSGALSDSEFAVEKAVILRLPADDPVQRRAAAKRPPPGPSLLGRLFNWKLAAAGIVLGLGLSYYSYPQDLLTLVQRFS
ncbi:MAG TPA: SHOCT domain-containing protein [Allosphingosinicella sp.]|nr:SHOCT domain-containing protein [Allosphingosinicella sp.]